MLRGLQRDLDLRREESKIVILVKRTLFLRKEYEIQMLSVGKKREQGHAWRLTNLADSTKAGHSTNPIFF